MGDQLCAAAERWVRHRYPLPSGGLDSGREMGGDNRIETPSAIHFADWTKPAKEVDPRTGTRWGLIGNAVCVRVAGWIGRRLSRPAGLVVQLCSRGTRHILANGSLRG